MGAGTDRVLKDRTDWQDLATANNGNVPYYSNGDGSTTFRVPSLKCWIKGANGTVSEVGSYLEAGLPNITGAFSSRMSVYGGNYSQVVFATNNGAFHTYNDSQEGVSVVGGGSGGSSMTVSEFDASRSNSIYGNSTTVQPESIVGMWLVKAYGTIVDTGQIDEQQYIDDRIATRLPLTGGTMLGDITLSDGGHPLSTEGGIMNGDINYSSPVMQDTSWSVTNPSDYKCLMSKYGTKGTLPDSSNYKCAILPLVISRDASDLINNDEKSRYACIENLVWADGGNNLSFRVYKNGAGETDSVQLYMDYGTTSGDEKQLVFDGKRIDVKAVGTNYIRYGNGIQICWGGYTGTGSFPLTITYPAAFVEYPSIGIQSGNFEATSWGYNNFKLAMAAGHTKPSTVYFKYIAIGRWK